MTTETAIITRAEFWKRHDALNAIEGKGVYDKAAHFALHREYWGAYVRAFNIKAPRHLLEGCRAALEAGDVHLNSPHTALKDWDNATYLTSNVRLRTALRENGESWCLSTNTCLLKEAARQELEATGVTLQPVEA